MSLAMVAAYAQFAAATAILSISDGTTTIVATDPLNTGVLTAQLPGVNWMVSITAGLSMPISGTEIKPVMDVNSIDASSNRGGTLTIWFSDTGFGPLSSGEHFKSDVGGTTIGTVSVNTYYYEGAYVNQMGNPFVGTLATTQSFSAFPAGGITPFSGTSTSAPLSGGLDNPYSLTEVIVIKHNGRGITSFDASLTTAPEPSGLVLLGTGLSALGLLYRRKRNNK
jgi:hypothetical protein